MGEQMNFPNTFKEFAEQYKTIDTKEVYSNGIEYIPIFRVEQWLEYISAVEMATFKSVIDSLEQQLKTAKAEAYKEFAEKANEIIDLIVDLMFDDSVSKCQLPSCHKPSNIPCENEICIQENKEYWHSKLDNILKELVGENDAR